MERIPQHYLHIRPDGRHLNLYSREPRNYRSLPEAGPETGTENSAPSHLRWHPMRDEWVAYAAARQNRTFKPPAEFCPLCPSVPGGLQSEIPFDDFEIAVFDNKFPALQPGSTRMPDWYVATPMLPAAGKCEVIIYSAEHGGSLGTLPDERLALLVDVWIDRYRALRGKNGIKYVMPFENRGEEAGVTLHHPHGQIYAFNTVPPLAERFAASFSHFSVNDLLAKHRGTYKVFGDDLMTAFVPPFARYSYEIWIVANRAIPGPWAFTAEEKNSFALMLKNTVRLYDKFYGRIAPYLYTMHAAPLDQDDTFEFTSQFYPLLRTPQKLKFLGGVEQGTGLFLNDVLPEDAVSQLRAVASALGL